MSVVALQHLCLNVTKRKIHGLHNWSNIINGSKHKPSRDSLTSHLCVFRKRPFSHSNRVTLPLVPSGEQPQPTAKTSLMLHARALASLVLDGVLFICRKMLKGKIDLWHEEKHYSGTWVKLTSIFHFLPSSPKTLILSFVENASNCSKELGSGLQSSAYIGGLLRPLVVPRKRKK